MPKVKNSSKGTLGRSLMKNIKKKAFVPNDLNLQEAKFIHRDNNEEIRRQQEITDLRSVIDQDNLGEFLQTAELAEKQFDAQRGIKIAKDDKGQEIIFDPRFGQDEEVDGFDVRKNLLLSKLRIPRKPEWNKSMSVRELHSKENEAFLSWRRGLARVEKDNYDLQITPYEKNPEVWKQLWRVVERSEILVQIVDGRDPLFYRCEDLEAYVREQGEHKQNFLLINKSDLLSDEIRQQWNKFFLEQNIQHMFFSAKKEQEIINNTPQQELENNVLYDLYKDEESNKPQQEDLLNTYKIASRQNLIYSLQKLITITRQKKFQKKATKLVKKPIDELISEQPNFEDDEEETKQDQQQDEQKLDNLISKLDDELDLNFDEEEANAKKEPKQRNPNLVTIGMVGYPNVGKSSVINALCNKKLVGVGNMPGKTRNFQTVFIQEDVLLCDCPGLVFPNAGSTRGEMVCNGVLPIDRLTDYYSPIDLLCERIPTIVFEKLYTLDIGVTKITAQHLLCSYAIRKGYMRTGAQPDEAKSAKYILKNFINGILIYCKLPPTYDVEKDGQVWQSNPLKEISDQKDYLQTLEQNKVHKQQQQLEEQIFQDDLDEITQIQFDEDDLVDLMEGKKVNGVKLTKTQRREIKFQFQRGEQIDFKKYLKKEQIQQYGVKNKNPQYL